MSNSASKLDYLLYTSNIKNMGKMKKINILGENYNYKNRTELSKLLGISKENTKELLKTYKEGGFIKIVRNTNTNKIVKIDMREQPLLLKKFLKSTKKNVNSNEVRNALITNTSVNNMAVSTYISKSQKIKIVLKITFDATISMPNDIMGKTFLSSAVIGYRKGLLIKPEDITDNLIKSLVKKYMPSVKESENETYEILTYGSNEPLELDGDYDLFDENALDISPLFNEVIDNTSGDCVRDYLKKVYKKTLSHKYIDTMRTIDDIKNFAIKYDIKMLCYDIQGNLQYSHYPKENKTKRKNLIFIAHNNHLYPLKNSLLNRTKKQKNLPLKYCVDTNEAFLHILKKFKVMPTFISFTVDKNHGINIFGFTYNGFIHHSNDEYDLLRNLLSSYGLEDNMTPFVNRKNIAGIIEKLYLKKNIDSFLPPNPKFIQGGFNYLNQNVLDTVDNIDDIITMDKCKAHSYALKDLPFLIKCDIRNTPIHKKCKDLKKFIPHYLYLVKPQNFSILLSQTKLYSGEYMNKVVENTTLKFKVLEYIECEKVENYFTPFITDLYDKCEKLKDLTLAKEIVNIHIGKMERFDEYEIKYEIGNGIYNKNTVYNKKEKRINGGFVEILDKRREISDSDYKTGLYVKFDEKIKTNIYNRKPINIQVKDHTRWILFEKMCDLGLHDDDIIQIKTDSISFKNRDNIEYRKYIDAHNIEKWKLEKFSKITPHEITDNYDITFKYTNDKINNTELGNCYAGCGKTFHILNNILPHINKYINDKDETYNYENLEDDYIVIAPQHSCIKEYRRKNINAQVARAYDFKKEIPDEKVIIIDEIGLLGRKSWDMLYKCKLMGKIIIGYGDFKQLIPVDKFKIKNHFLKFFFTEIVEMTTNHRNDFTKDYYDTLINATDIKYCINEINKHSEKSYKDADIIITYTNKTRMEYNEKMAKHLGFTDKKDIGVKCILLSNELRDMEIYNKYDFTVIANDGEFITINDELKDYKIQIDDYEEFFDYAYCRTIYSIQGESIPKYYWTNTTTDNKYLTGIVAYTIISRKKTK